MTTTAPKLNSRYDWFSTEGEGPRELHLPREDPAQELYDNWHRFYKAFRAAEEQEMFGETPPTEARLRSHRDALLARLFWATQRLPVLEAHRPDLAEVLNVWMDALRESLELWHPKGPAEPELEHELDKLFDASAA